VELEELKKAQNTPKKVRFDLRLQEAESALAQLQNDNTSVHSHGNGSSSSLSLTEPMVDPTEEDLMAIFDTAFSHTNSIEELDLKSSLFANCVEIHELDESFPPDDSIAIELDRLLDSHSFDALQESHHRHTYVGNEEWDLSQLHGFQESGLKKKKKKTLLERFSIKG
jgi:hypothetical protein